MERKEMHETKTDKQATREMKEEEKKEQFVKKKSNDIERYAVQGIFWDFRINRRSSTKEQPMYLPFRIIVALALESVLVPRLEWKTQEFAVYASSTHEFQLNQFHKNRIAREHDKQQTQEKKGKKHKQKHEINTTKASDTKHRRQCEKSKKNKTRANKHTRH